MILLREFQHAGKIIHEKVHRLRPETQQDFWEAASVMSLSQFLELIPTMHDIDYEAKWIRDAKKMYEGDKEMWKRIHGFDNDDEA